jgi:integrase
MNGGVRRRSNGEWEYRFDAGQDPLTGKRFRPGRSGFKTKREAEQALRKAIAAHESGRSVKANYQTVGEFLTQWLQAVRPSLRASTWASYRNYVDAYVIPTIGDSRLRDLTPVRLNLLYGHLLEHGRVKRTGGLAAKTVRNVHVMLHRALGDALRWDLLPRNVAEDATPPRVSRKRPTVWTPEQLGLFVDHVEGDRFFALWLLVVTTGFRRGELAGLLRHDVDLHHGRVTPSAPRVVVDGRAQESETKTRSGERSLALDPTSWDALRDYITFWDKEREALGQSTQLLFVWPNGNPIHPDTITALFHKHCAAAGLPRIRLHDVRHSYATAALKAGIPPKVISERLGHATVAFTLQTYTHVIPGMDEAAAGTVAELILGDLGGRRTGRQGVGEGPEDDKGPADILRFRRSAGPSIRSGGRI